MTAATARAILIVEDDPALNEAYQYACWSAVQEVNNEGLDTKYNVLQAYSQAEAQSLLDNQTDIDFVSIDLALQDAEKGLRNQDRLDGHEAGGMLILKQLKEEQRQTFAIVVSGETLLSYATDALQKYGVLHFFEKSRLDIEQYKAAIKATLWYRYAANHITQLEHNDAQFTAIESVWRAWQQSITAATAAGFDAQRFPDNLGRRLDTFLDKYIDATTKLPTGRLVKHQLITRVLQQQWPIISVQITNFRAFQAHYPSQVEPFLFFIAAMLKQLTEQYPQTFIGLLGQSIIVEPSFVVMLDKSYVSDLPVLQASIEQKIEQKASYFVNRFQREQTPIVPTAVITTWDNQEVPFTDVHELLDALGTPT